MKYNLNKIYFDHKIPAGLSSKENLYKESKKVYPTLKHSDVEKYLKGNEVYTIHKPSRKRYPTNKTLSESVDHIWQADLSDMKHISVYNDGFKYLLFVIDVYTRFLWVKPLLNKTARTTAKAMLEIFKDSSRIPAYLCTDKGSEFIGSDFQKLLEIFGITSFIPNSVHKASIAERCQRTIKNRMSKYFTLHNTFRYIDVLDELIDCFNSTKHSRLKRSPNDILASRYNYTDSCGKTSTFNRKLHEKFKVNDYVRISLVKDKFAKEYDDSWSREIFRVSCVIKKQPNIMYKLTDLKGDAIEGRFYNYELQSVLYDPNKVYHIEKVIKTYYDKAKKKRMAIVKWLGWPDKFNSTLPLSKVEKINKLK